MDWPVFAAQCCDAQIYLQLGQQCAVQGECYNDLRPMGINLWHSLPYRLGLPPQGLILLNYLLLCASVLLSAVYFSRQQACQKPDQHQDQQQQNQGPKKIGRFVCMMLFSACVHGLFFYPVLYTSLSDAPAALFMLLGSWLFIIRGASDRAQRLHWACGSLCWGLAVWMRAFYLYPVLVSLGLFLLYTLISFSKQSARQKKSFSFALRPALSFVLPVVLPALLPILFQYQQTREHSGQWGFINPETSSQWSESHFDNSMTGYDTILPFDYHSWNASCAQNTLLNAIKQVDVYSAACIVGGRLHFYLGSYSAQTYQAPYPHHKTSQIILDDPLFAGSTINNAANDTANNTTSDAHSKSTRPDRFDTHFIVPVFLEQDFLYRISTQLHTPEGIQHLRFGVREQVSARIAAESPALLIADWLQDEMHLASTEFLAERSGIYEIYLSSELPDGSEDLIAAAQALGQSFNQGPVHVQGLQIEQTARTPPPERHWSSALLLANLLALGVFLYGFIYYSIYYLPDRQTGAMLLLPALAALLCLAQSVLIVPEQRFIIYPLTLLWLNLMHLLPPLLPRRHALN